RRTVKIYSLKRVSEITREDSLIHFDVETACSKGTYVRTGSFHIEMDETVIHFDVETACSKGTYVRTLAVDIGRGLSVHAHMSKLIRTSSCGIGLDRAITMEELQDMDHRKAVVPLLEILKDEPAVDITDTEFLFRIRNGQKMSKSDIMDSVEDDEAE